MRQATHEAYIYKPHGHLPLPCLLVHFKVAKFEPKKTRRSSKRLHQYVIPSTTPNRRDDGTGQIYEVSLRRERNRPKERRLSLENFINKPSFPSLGSRPENTYRAVRKLLTK